MNLIDKYIAEVGKHLPRRNRADIEAEIRSTLEDMLDERKRGAGPADEATIMKLLKEYGSPREVAATYPRDVTATYQAHPYLIGPRLFPFFEMVVRIVFAAFAGASLIGFGVGLTETGLTGPAFVSNLGQWFGDLISGLIAAFGNVVLVFAILERTQVAGKIEKEFKEWDPEELKSEPDPDKIDLADHIATLIFTLLGLIVLNLYPNLLAIRYTSDGTGVTLPVLTEAFFRFLPWINIMGLVQILYSGFMLGQRDWTPVTRILGILIDIAGMILAVVIMKTPGIFGVTPESLASIGLAEAADDLAGLFNFLPAIIITIVVLVTGIKVIKSLIRLFAGKTRSPYPVIK